MTRLAGRPVLSAALIYAVLSLVFVGQGLLPGRALSSSDMLWSTAPWTDSAPSGVRWGGANFETADAVTVFQPFFQYVRDALPHIPLWNPHIMAGRPFVANAQSAVFSPFTWPAYVLPFWKSLAVMAVLKLFVAAFGTFLLGRALGMRFGGALLAGAVFSFGTFFVVWLAWPLTNVFPLLPWLLLLSELLIRRPQALVGAGLAGVVGLTFLGGHPETSFHVLVTTVAFFAFRLALAWSRGGRRRELLTRPAVAFALALAGGAAIAAVMLVPLLEFMLHSGDYEHRLGLAPGHTLAKYLGAMFLFDYWGRPTQTSLIPDLVSNRGFYAGGITLMLASAALILRPTATRVAFAVYGALVLAVVLGAEPIFSIVTALPGFRTAHNGRMVIFFLFVLAMLAGWGLDEVTSGERSAKWRRNAVLGAGAVILVVPVVWLVASGDLALSRFSDALERGLGLRRPAGAGRPGRRGSARSVVRGGAAIDHRDRPAQRSAAMAPARGGRAGGHRAQPRDAPPARPHAPRGRRRGDRVHGARGRPVPGEHGLQHGDPGRARGAAGDGSAPLSRVARAEPVRRAQPAGHRAAAPAQPVDAVRALRRARIRLSGRARATTRSGVPPPRRPASSCRPPAGRSPPSAHSAP